MSMQEVQILLHDLENVIQNLGIEHVTIQAEHHSTTSMIFIIALLKIYQRIQNTELKG